MKRLGVIPDLTIGGAGGYSLVEHCAPYSQGRELYRLRTARRFVPEIVILMSDQVEDFDEETPPEYRLHQRAVENDPNRCDGVTPHGPCPYVRVPGARFCAVHGGASALTRAKLQSKRRYMGAQWAAQIGEFADDPELKRLNQEIGILRMLLDKTLQRCLSESDLLLRSSTIGELIDKIGRLVTSCHQIDQKLGVMLDKAELTEFGSFIVELASEFITDSDALDRFIGRMVSRIKSLGTAEDRATTVLARLA